MIRLTGGSLNMEARCTIAGAGDLLVDAGAHNMAFSINAHITISNVSYPHQMVWKVLCLMVLFLLLGFVDLAV